MYLYFEVGRDGPCNSVSYPVPVDTLFLALLVVLAGKSVFSIFEYLFINPLYWAMYGW